MRNRFVATLVVLLALILIPSGAVAKSEKSPEIGVWKIKLAPDAEAAAKGEKESDDTLIFKKGKFRSTGCESYGFGSSPYKMDGSTFMAEQESKKEGKTHWHGEIDGDRVTGKMTWTKLDGAVLNYAFEGTRSLEGEKAQTQTRGN